MQNKKKVIPEQKQQQQLVKSLPSPLDTRVRGRNRWPDLKGHCWGQKQGVPGGWYKPLLLATKYHPNKFQHRNEK